MLKRKLEKELSLWATRFKRKPLMLRGARQVGKSTLVRKFASENGFRLREINLEKHLSLERIFAGFKIEKTIEALENVLQAKINSETDILFLDEIQATPSAIPALRYFYEERPELRVISAGSLLEFIFSEHEFSMPVGRIEYLYVGPMSFEEFLESLGKEYLLEKLYNFNWTDFWSEQIHEELLELQKQYFLIGGLPEAVFSFVQTKNYREVERVHKGIAETYRDDFSKYRKSVDLILLQEVYEKIPQEICRKVKYTSFSETTTSKNTKKALELLLNARVISAVYHTTATAAPLRAGERRDVFKVIHLDIGLMTYQLGFSISDIQEVSKVDLVNKGNMAEQFIGQHLRSIDLPQPSHTLSYWLREGKAHNAEVDYLMTKGHSVYPIEVKSGKSGSLRSLHQFMHKSQLPLAFQFYLSAPTTQQIETSVVSGNSKQRSKVNYSLCSLPLYMIEQLPRLITSSNLT